MPVFLPNIPQPTDQLSVSQGNILNNFTILGAIAGNTNPSSASINANSGFNWIYLPTQAGSIPPSGASFAAGNVGIYSATDPVTGQNELYVNKTNQTTVMQIPITGSILSVTSAPGNNSNGWAYLGGGILWMWGRGNTGNVAAGSYVIPLPGGFPAFSQVFNIQLTPIANGSSDPKSSFNAQAALTGGQNITVYQSSRTTSGNPTNFTQFFYSIIGIPTSY
jgi:hypothetical protein